MTNEFVSDKIASASAASNAVFVSDKLGDRDSILGKHYGLAAKAKVLLAIDLYITRARWTRLFLFDLLNQIAHLHSGRH
eukprot:m.490956 g.490956  ORF g.490956 m.490956 type:complete len:79 (+) comp57255_c0_seq21:196-432(+)